jgi:predicted RNA-binding protein with RPS1 domain
MLKFEIRQYLNNNTKTVLDLDENGVIALVIKESKKYTNAKPRMTRDDLEKIIYKSFKDAVNTFKGYTVRY